jgi:hypothetical protein
MEVHSHTHTPRKKWTHYFWEFLMLFLAVFCGFLAEYQLEHKIEKERGRQYVISFYEDLVTDTPRFNNIIMSYRDQVTALTASGDCYRAILENKKSDPCIISLIFNTLGFKDLVFTDRTLQQLKNSGGLRLLKKEDADSILLYDDLLRTYIKQETTGFQETQYKIRDLAITMLNHQWAIDGGQASKYPVLYAFDAEQINRYFNLLFSYNFYCTDHREKMKTIKRKADSLLKYFKEKYHLK